MKSVKRKNGNTQMDTLKMDIEKRNTEEMRNTNRVNSGNHSNELDDTLRYLQADLESSQDFLEALEVSEEKVEALEKDNKRKNFIIIFLLVVLIILGILFVIEGGYLSLFL